MSMTVQERGWLTAKQKKFIGGLAKCFKEFEVIPVHLLLGDGLQDMAADVANTGFSHRNYQLKCTVKRVNGLELRDYYLEHTLRRKTIVEVYVPQE